MRHNLKIWPQYYKPVAEGLKTFEIRKNDRGFQAGDEVELREWDPTVIREQCESSGVTYKIEKGYTHSPSLKFKIGFGLCLRRIGGRLRSCACGRNGANSEIPL